MYVDKSLKHPVEKCFRKEIIIYWLTKQHETGEKS